MIEHAGVMDIRQPMPLSQFFDTISNALASDLNIPAADLRDLLVRRENEVTTVLAPGLAVPHIIIQGEQKFAMLLVRCRSGIVFADDKPPVHAAFVLVGSKDERRFHLEALSAIAQIVMDPRFEKKWMRARDKEGLRELMLHADPDLPN